MATSKLYDIVSISYKMFRDTSENKFTDGRLDTLLSLEFHGLHVTSCLWPTPFEYIKVYKKCIE